MVPGSLVRARDRAYEAAFLFPAALSRLGVVDRERGEEAFDLALPVMVSGAVRTLLRTADFFMVSLALPAAAVAGLEFAFQYFFIGFGLALALSSGTISVVSRLHGAGDRARARLAVKQSIWLSAMVAAPLTAGAFLYADPLIGLLTDDAAAIEQGAIYLRIVMAALVFRFVSIVAARAFQGAGDTRTPMYVNLVTVPTNVALNAVLIFGLGPAPRLGIAGAAWGTVVANTLSAGIFTYLLVGGHSDVGIRIGGPQWDTSLAAEIVRVGSPLAGSRLVQTLGRFPFLFILASLGTPVVAAYAIGRRVIMLALMPAWGYSTASSTLVGQSIGAGEQEEAARYGWSTLRIALATQLLIAAVLIVLARPIAAVFNTEPIGLTVEFVRVFGLAVGGFSVGRTMQGALRGAGDTTWPLYGKILGLLVRLSVAVLALDAATAFTLLGMTLTPGLGLGVLAVYIAILADFYLQAGVNITRFWSGKWQAIARRAEEKRGAAGD
jgi:putative MATE family efflux protein